MVPQLGIEPRTQGFSVGVFIKTAKSFKKYFLIILDFEAIIFYNLFVTCCNYFKFTATKLQQFCNKKISIGD